MTPTFWKTNNRGNLIPLSVVENLNVLGDVLYGPISGAVAPIFTSS